ncbi:helix-turn-helix domain-containing protein [Streptomyces sp. NPDC056656]|uniref:helix-turn-helix domain-containing protein n=1 Tax=Streptomyces sp. NPDC056656 TaxID=3345895 RepID=UPI003686ED29
MSVTADSGDGAEGDAGWDVDPDNDSVALVEALGRQLRMWREAVGLRAAEFGALVGYGENQVYKLESGKRIPRPEFLVKADEVLSAGGKIAAMADDVAQARYPKKVRELAKLEARAVELALYSNHNIHGLLQTEEFARALLRTRRPTLSSDELERAVAARVARQSIYKRSPGPELSFVQEEVTLRRPIGGAAVMRRQLERLLKVGQLPNVDVQVMPTCHASHPGTGGLIEVLKFEDGSGVGRSDGAFNGRLVSDPRQLRILELRYGIIRAEALTSQESLAFVEQVLGET